MLSAEFQYDLNGNLTSDGQRAFFWNEENKLVYMGSRDSVTGKPDKIEIKNEQ